MCLATSPIMIQLCFPPTPHWPLLKQVTSSPQWQPCAQQQCWLECLSAHAAQFQLFGKPFVCSSRSSHMTGKGSQYLAFSRQSKNFLVAATRRKIGNVWSDLVTLETSEHCGGAQSSWEGSCWAGLGVPRPAAWAAMQHCVFLVWLHLLVYFCSWHCLSSLLGGVTVQEETNRLW